MHADSLSELGLRRGIVAAAFAAALLAGGCRREPPPPPQVEINGKTWFVDLAVTFDQQYRGLAGREHVADDEGMLFIFETSEVRKFCMRGCVVPLDVAFIDADGTVVRTHTMAVEPDLAGRIAYSSEVPAKYALEVAGGSLAAADVAPGDTASFRGDIPR